MKCHAGLRLVFLVALVLTPKFTAIAEGHRLPAAKVLAWPPAQQEDAVTHYNLGIALKAKGDLDGAIAEYRAAINQLPNYPEAHLSLGIALYLKGDRDGVWSIWITGNYRLTFEIDGEDATNVDLEDYH